MAITENVKALNKEHNRVASAKAQGIDPTLKAALLDAINSGRGNVSRAGIWSLGGDIKDLALITRQVRLYSNYVVELGGSASPTEVDKFAETATGILFWGYSDGVRPYEQTPSKIMFGTYFKQTIGEEVWTKSKGKLEILRFNQS